MGIETIVELLLFSFAALFSLKVFSSRRNEQDIRHLDKKNASGQKAF
jgi:hypothetical protein